MLLKNSRLEQWSILVKYFVYTMFNGGLRRQTTAN